MRTLSILCLALVAQGCVVHLATYEDPTFATHVDPSIADDRDRAPYSIAWVRLGGRSDVAIGALVIAVFDPQRHAETLDRLRAASERIPKPIRVSEVVPAAVLDRLDAQRL